MKEIITKFSFGVGDRFAHQAKAQLAAIKHADDAGVELTPVWNKSYREHQTISSEPITARQQADIAVKDLTWQKPYLVDADHINLETVDFFMDHCDFFTLDVADFIGEKVEDVAIDDFVKTNSKYIGELVLPVLNQKLEINEKLIKNVAEKYLYAAQQAGRIFRHIASQKAEKPFVIEVSMDETDQPQTPGEMFLILSALSAEKIPLQTIAPKFSGRFNKGVDYVGDLQKFKQEFEQDLAVLKVAIKEFSLPQDLKLSVHSGSDKFSIYPIIREAINKFNAGLHLKTAGTTWLEELIGLAEAGGEGLKIAQDIYRKSLDNFDELCAPYASVIDIDKNKLPTADEVSKWDGIKFSESLRHDQQNLNYNLHFRQLLHVGYKMAAKMGDTYLKALEKNEDIITKNVTENIFERHIRPLFF
ncbi:MAG: hypothetical protein D8M58_05035 [Calditrichaeota bacterium]|nr:MAG: hypothetical protein DWQ03_02040 [Calditrichota bacterium]MBL1204738.1 hypothetical protein [Calditrichota bacterium]NOG44566.1 hypothetical protein [Calditrichota bacterium]